jgi:hypothetical protein
LVEKKFRRQIGAFPANLVKYLLGKFRQPVGENHPLIEAQIIFCRKIAPVRRGSHVELVAQRLRPSR